MRWVLTARRPEATIAVIGDINRRRNSALNTIAPHRTEKAFRLHGELA
jgi:hypothetical protein